MSNLGVVVQLKTVIQNDQIFRFKEKFPVVYENKEFVYCKQSGNNSLTYFYKPEFSESHVNPLIYYSTFCNNRSKYVSEVNCSTINILVDHFSDDSFEEWCDSTASYELNKYYGKLNQQQKNLAAYKESIISAQRMINRLEQDITDTVAKISDLEKRA